MTTPARFKQSDIDRVLRSAIKRGAKKVRVLPDGTIDILISEEQLTGADKISAPAEVESIVGPFNPESKKAIF